MCDSNREGSDSGIYPMDFTSVDMNSDQQNTFVNQGYTQPGIFSPSHPGWTSGTQHDSEIALNSAQPSQDPATPHSNSVYSTGQYSPPLMTSTPIPGRWRSVNDYSAYSSDSKNSSKWRGFFIKWITSIVLISVVMGIVINVYPLHQVVCWLNENCIVIPTTIFILFLLTVIFKMAESDISHKGSSKVQHDFSPSEQRSFILPEKNLQNEDSKVKKKLTFEPEVSFGDSKGQFSSRSQIQVKRTFSGTTSEVWADFICYYENIAGLNGWDEERKRRVLLSTLRGQAESYVHGLQENHIRRWASLLQKMEFRFGHSNMKEAYLVEAKLRKRKPGESFRDLGQAIEDLYRRAYPTSPDTVQENSIKTFLDACGESEEFRLAVRRSRPKTLQDAVTSAMQEECIRMSERTKYPVKRNVYSIESIDMEKQNGSRQNTKTPYQKFPNGGGRPTQRKGRDSQFQSKRTQKSKDNVVCYGCGRIGHYKSRCDHIQKGSVSPPVQMDGEKVISPLNGARSEQ